MESPAPSRYTGCNEVDVRNPTSSFGSERDDVDAEKREPTTQFGFKPEAEAEAEERGSQPPTTQFGF